MSLIYRLTELILDTVSLTVIFFVGLRIIFRLFSANPSASFVAWIYSISATLINPFQGIFRSFPIPGIGVIDVTAIVALVIYAIIIQLITFALRSIAIAPDERFSKYHRHI